MQSFHRRKLPEPPATAFSSAAGRALFKEALDAGTMDCFFPLIEQFRTQDEPAFCGLATLSMVLNALGMCVCDGDTVNSAVIYSWCVARW